MVVDRPEIRSRQFLTVRDLHGVERAVGVGYTDDGRVAVIGTAGGVGVLSPQEAVKYLVLVHEALLEAAERQL